MRRKRALRDYGDDDLMPLVAGKDAEAFEIFFDRHAGAAYSLAHRILGDPKLAEDVTQESFLSIWRSPSGFDQARGSVRAWTLGIVRNRAIDAIRRASAKRIPPIEFDGTEALDNTASSAETEAEVLSRETTREVRGALALLPSDQSQVVELAYFGGFSQSEIAEFLNLPLGTVKSRLRLALEKVRVELAESYQ